MKRLFPIILLLAILSAISGVLMSEINFIGSMGIWLIHKEYHFLKIWWQGGLAVFIALLVLLTIQGILNTKLAKGVAIMMQLVLFFIALAGLYFTYNDFRHDFTHKIVGERFHLGVYLFWVGWMVISLYYMFSRRQVLKVSADADQNTKTL
ncbi:MAG: cytochrome d ubiquinol oxidase subunit II [Flavipsychrobacter sp.]|nr:cytochrome d ubiquinol oxidase subunit II [Flavipsychrobacter sp.]